MAKKKTTCSCSKTDEAKYEAITYVAIWISITIMVLGFTGCSVYLEKMF